MTQNSVFGYKMFNNDWTCRGFQYEMGKTYHYDGEISLCNAGFHFCEKLEDCFKNYDCVPWNKIAKIEAKGNVIKGDDKCVTDTILILEEIKFNQINEIIKAQLINGVNWSDGVNRSYGVNESYCVNRSNGVNWSDGVNESYGVNRSYCVNRSNGVNESYGVNKSDGVNRSNGVNGSYGVINCAGISSALFCSSKKNQYYLFNKKVKKKYWEDVNEKFKELLDGWSPTFNNLKGLYLKSGEKWAYTPIPQAQELSIKEAWQGMPKQAIEYLKSLPEFNAKIFAEITGIE